MRPSSSIACRNASFIALLLFKMLFFKMFFKMQDTIMVRLRCRFRHFHPAKIVETAMEMADFSCGNGMETGSPFPPFPLETELGHGNGDGNGVETAFSPSLLHSFSARRAVVAFPAQTNDDRTVRRCIETMIKLRCRAQPLLQPLP